MPRAAKLSQPSGEPVKTGKNPPFPPLRHCCPEVNCLWSFRRPSDLARHQQTHMPLEEQEQKQRLHRCPYCFHTTLQRSNMATHRRTHTGEKPKCCPDCDYTTSDPASLTHHRKRVHGYMPRTRQSRYATVAEAADAPYFPPDAVSPAAATSSSSTSSSLSPYSDFPGDSSAASSASSFDSVPPSPRDTTSYHAFPAMALHQGGQPSLYQGGQPTAIHAPPAAVWFNDPAAAAAAYSRQYAFSPAQPACKGFVPGPVAPTTPDLQDGVYSELHTDPEIDELIANTAGLDSPAAAYAGSGATYFASTMPSQYDAVMPAYSEYSMDGQSGFDTGGAPPTQPHSCDGSQAQGYFAPPPADTTHPDFLLEW